MPEHGFNFSRFNKFPSVLSGQFEIKAAPPFYYLKIQPLRAQQAPDKTRQDLYNFWEENLRLPGRNVTKWQDKKRQSFELPLFELD